MVDTATVGYYPHDPVTNLTFIPAPAPRRPPDPTGPTSAPDIGVHTSAADCTEKCREQRGLQVSSYTWRLVSSGGLMVLRKTWFTSWVV